MTEESHVTSWAGSHGSDERGACQPRLLYYNGTPAPAPAKTPFLDVMTSMSSEKNSHAEQQVFETTMDDDIEMRHATTTTPSNLHNYGIESALPPPPQLSEEEERRIWRKVDLRLMPILSLMYLLSFMDRGNIGNAKLEGLIDQLNLTGNRYNVALTMYFIPYCIFETPSNLVIKTLRPSRWLPFITVVWGIVMTMMGLVKTYPQLVGVRVCLGVAEAGLFPGVVYYLTLWYPRYMLQYRIGIFFGAATVAGAFSGLLAYGIGFMDGIRGLEGWSWIFILEGLGTVLVGIVAFFVLVDFPSTASFLSPEERAFIMQKKKYDSSSVGEEEHFALRHVVAVLTDWQLYIQLLIYMSIVAPLYGISLFLPSIINGFGYNDAYSQLLTVPPYIFATIITLLFGHYSDKYRNRSAFIFAGLLFCVLGFGINVADVPIGVKYFGTFFCVAGSYGAFPGVVSWLGNNLSGQYKRGVGMAFHIGIGNFAGAIAANIYRTEDSPRYVLGHALELMFVGIGLVCTPIAVLIYKRINQRRAMLIREWIVREGGLSKDGSGLRPHSLGYTDEELRRMGDRAPDFRYMI